EHIGDLRDGRCAREGYEETIRPVCKDEHQHGCDQLRSRDSCRSLPRSMSNVNENDDRLRGCCRSHRETTPDAFAFSGGVSHVVTHPAAFMAKPIDPLHSCYPPA